MSAMGISEGIEMKTLLDLIVEFVYPLVIGFLILLVP
jgi:hypothetical protein